MRIRIVILLFVAAIQSSCFPAQSVSRHGITATLIDAHSNTPITKTEVTVTIDDKEFRSHSDDVGFIRVEPDHRLHLSWLGGPAIHSNFETKITVFTNGYIPVSITWFRYSSERNSGRLEDGGVIDVGRLALKKP
jgi:hypothetical protein